MLPSYIEDAANSAFLTDVMRALRSICSQYGLALNDDLITISDHIREKAADYTMLDTDHNVLMDATAGALVVTLPPAADAEPHVFRVKKTDSSANTVTVQRAGSDTIDGATSKILTDQYDLVALVSDRSSAWHVLHDSILEHIRSKSAGYTMLDSDHNVLVDATAGAVAITLPSAASADSHIFRVKKIDVSANVVTVQRAGSDTIDGATSKPLSAQYELISLVSDRSSAWHTLHHGAP
jgi:hypothetical protein